MRVKGQIGQNGTKRDREYSTYSPTYKYTLDLLLTFMYLTRDGEEEAWVNKFNFTPS